MIFATDALFSSRQVTFKYVDPLWESKHNSPNFDYQVWLYSSWDIKMIVACDTDSLCVVFY